jgi:two-component system, OmpR family, phosphate regulon response regulator PhoB
MLATDTNKQILIVDRDIAAIEPLRQKLADSGFQVRAITDGSAAVTAVAQRPLHLVIIDWHMPGLAGLEVMQSLRKARFSHGVRSIILSALAAERDVVRGLDAGADDYIAKPFSLHEAVARVFAVLRQQQRTGANPALCCDELVLDISTNRVTASGCSVDLRGIKFRLLKFLMSHTGGTFDRNQLLEEVWGSDSDVDQRIVDVNVQRLRKILAETGHEAYIQTVRGFGYRFDTPSVKS